MYQVVSVRPQADIVFYAAVRADAVKHGEDVQEYYKS